MPQVWVVRAGGAGEFADDFECFDSVAIGFNPLPEPAPSLAGMSPVDIEDWVDRAFAHKRTPPRARAAYAAMLNQFVHEVKQGDLVVTPIRRQRELLIGKVTGDYRYSATPLIKDFRHYRSVDWIGRFPKSLLPSSVPANLGNLKTIFKPTGSEDFRRISANITG